MKYFGTNLTEHGHYTWDLFGEQMLKIGLLPRNTPFNPEELTKNLPKGENAFYQSSKFTVLAISGSCKDDRPGTKSIFWIEDCLSKNDIIAKIKNNKLAMSIINAMPFNVNDFNVEQ